MKKYCFGIDIGGTTVKCGLFNVDGEVLDKWEIKTRTENNGENIIADIAETMNAKIAEKGLDKEEIVGAGVGVPGPADEEGNVPVAVNLHWGFVPLSKELSEKTGLAVRVGNDANVAALGEMWKGGAVGYHNVVMVTLGTGVGGGIIINGKIVTGSNGAGGEIGHIHVTDSVDKPCNCGNTGCLEQVASATGVVYLANKKLASCDTPSVLRDGEVSAKSVFDAVKAGDAVAQEIAEEFGRYLGLACANIAGVVDPQVFVIGGGVSKAGKILFDYIEKYYKKYAFPSCKDAKFALAMYDFAYHTIVPSNYADLKRRNLQLKMADILYTKMEGRQEDALQILKKVYEEVKQEMPSGSCPILHLQYTAALLAEVLETTEKGRGYEFLCVERSVFELKQPSFYLFCIELELAAKFQEYEDLCMYFLKMAQKHRELLSGLTLLNEKYDQWLFSGTEREIKNSEELRKRLEKCRENLLILVLSRLNLQ